MRVVSKAEFEERGIREIRGEVIDVTADVPDRVFAPKLPAYAWLEFEDVLQDEFFEVLLACAREHGDTRLWAQCDDAGIDADVGFSGCAEFIVGDQPEAYRAFLDKTNGSLSLRLIANRLLYWGDSREWAFVGNRSVELCVGGMRDHDRWPIVRNIRYHTWESVLELASGPFRKQLPERHRVRYERNYREGSWALDHYREG